MPTCLSQLVSGRTRDIKAGPPPRVWPFLHSTSCQVVPHFLSEKSLTPELPAGSFLLPCPALESSRPKACKERADLTCQGFYSVRLSWGLLCKFQL